MTIVWALVLATAPVMTVDGGLSKADVADALELAATEFAPCFTQATSKKPSVTYRFSVVDGRARDLAFRDASGMPGPGITCVGTALESAQFPNQPDAGTNIEWALTPRKPLAATQLPSEALAKLDEPATFCFSAANPGEKSEGAMEAQLRVTRSGVVAGVVVTSQGEALAPLKLESCLRNRVSGPVFPPAKSPRAVTARWIFVTATANATRHFDPEREARVIVADPRSVTRVTGGLEKDVIMKVIRRWTDQIRYCYETQLQRFPSLSGKVRSVWRIGPDGNVQHAEVSENTTGNDALAQCIVDRILRWEFPPPEGGVVVNVTFPWIFKVADDLGLDE